MLQHLSLHLSITIYAPFFASLSFSISNHLSKAGQSFLAFQRYKLGADSALFSQEYTDPSQDAAGAPYTSFGGDDLESPGGGGGQANNDGAFDGTGGYQRQDYWDGGIYVVGRIWLMLPKVSCLEQFVLFLWVSFELMQY